MAFWSHNYLVLVRLFSWNYNYCQPCSIAICKSSDLFLIRLESYLLITRLGWSKWHNIDCGIIASLCRGYAKNNYEGNGGERTHPISFEVTPPGFFVVSSVLHRIVFSCQDVFPSIQSMCLWCEDFSLNKNLNLVSHKIELRLSLSQFRNFT